MMSSCINLLVSGYTNDANRDGIYLISVEKNKLIRKQSIASMENPSFLISDPKGKIYAANEIDNKCNISIYLFIDQEVSYERQWNGNGNGVCHLSFDEQYNLLFASCYGSGHVICFDTEKEKAIGTFLPENSFNAHAHGTAISSNHKWLFSVDLGKDSLYSFRMEYMKQGILTPEDTLTLAEGTAPRQLIASRFRNQLYCIDEWDSSIKIIAYDDETGILSEICTVASTNKTQLPGQNFPGTSVVTKDEKYLIVPNRGADTIAIFEIKELELVLKYECDCYGRWPRYLMLSKEEEYLLTANQNSEEIILFSFQEGEKIPLCYLDRMSRPGASCIIEL